MDGRGLEKKPPSVALNSGDVGTVSRRVVGNGAVHEEVTISRVGHVHVTHVVERRPHALDRALLHGATRDLTIIGAKIGAEGIPSLDGDAHRGRAGVEPPDRATESHSRAQGPVLQERDETVLVGLIHTDPVDRQARPQC